MLCCLVLMLGGVEVCSAALEGASHDECASPVSSENAASTTLPAQ